MNYTFYKILITGERKTITRNEVIYKIKVKVDIYVAALVLSI